MLNLRECGFWTVLLPAGRRLLPASFVLNLHAIVWCFMEKNKSFFQPSDEVPLPFRNPDHSVFVWQNHSNNYFQAFTPDLHVFSVIVFSSKIKREKERERHL